MIGAAYWRSVHDAYSRGILKDRYNPRYQNNMGKDLLNSIIFSLVSVDLVSPFNGITLAGYSYSRDRGFAMEQEMIRNTEGMFDKNLGYFKEREAAGTIPMLLINGTIVNDGRKLLVASQPVSYLTQPEFSIGEPAPIIDAVDFSAFYSGQNPYNLRLTSALRMNATFPFILPVVKLPSSPRMNIMDAGLSDNFGIDLSSRYLFALRDWIKANTSDAILLQIRDTRENDVSSSSDESSLANMITDPVFVIQNKWEALQSYAQDYLKDFSKSSGIGNLHFVTLQYVPKQSKKVAALNFHLTQKEKEDLFMSVYNQENKAAIDTLVKYIR
jgi:hypothetical protein